MNYAQLRHYDVANGPGVRASIFVSGCRFNCKGCFNKEAQDFNYGNKFDKETEDKFMEYIKDDNVKGVSILGGEPLMQTMDDSLLNLLKRIKKESNKEIWMWTGFIYGKQFYVNKKDRHLCLSFKSMEDINFVL